MTRAPKGWGITGEIEDAMAPRNVAGTRLPQAKHGVQAQLCFWLGSLNRVPTVDEIRTRWGVSRPTAYRYRAFAESGGTTFVHPLQTNPKRSLPRKTA